jgi:hypothetical protein
MGFRRPCRGHITSWSTTCAGLSRSLDLCWRRRWCSSTAPRGWDRSVWASNTRQYRPPRNPFRSYPSRSSCMSAAPCSTSNLLMESGAACTTTRPSWYTRRARSLGCLRSRPSQCHCRFRRYQMSRRRQPQSPKMSETPKFVAYQFLPLTMYWSTKNGNRSVIQAHSSLFPHLQPGLDCIPDNGVSNVGSLIAGRHA